MHWGAYLGEMPLCPLLHFGADLRAAINEVEQVADIIDGKAKLAGAQDET